MEKENNGWGRLILQASLLIAIMTAIVRPLNQEIEALKIAQDNMEFRGTRFSSGEVAAMKVSLQEIETQFKNLNERTARIEISFGEKLKAMEEKLELEIRLEGKTGYIKSRP